MRDSSSVKVAPTMQTFPGDETAPAYRFAFRVFGVVFLLTLCIGLLNFLGYYLKSAFGS